MIRAEALLQAQTVAAVLGMVILWLLEGWWPFFTERKGRLRHAAPNLALALINTVVLGAVFAGLTAGAVAWAERAHFGLLRGIPAPVWVKTLVALVLIDAWMYAWHRANHRVPFLWRFHRVHHSDADVDVTTAARFHVGEITLSSMLRLAVFPLLGVALWQALLYEVILLPVIQFHHSNVALPERWDRLLRWLVVTPNMHRVHHSRWRPETDSNYASICSFWDRLAGTFRQVQDTHALRLGLDEWEGPEWQTVLGLLRTPFANRARIPSERQATPSLPTPQSQDGLTARR
ncbi:MAG TPA: sterol desaturase family protein [Chthonomonadaceae bacterium]|nr:sterol desaturase family protein [Chthonomonadaceae bacterium]